MKDLLTGLAFFGGSACICVAMDLIRKRANDKFFFVLTALFQALKILIFTGVYFGAGYFKITVLPALIGTAIGLTVPNMISSILTAGRAGKSSEKAETTDGTFEEKEDNDGRE